MRDASSSLDVSSVLFVTASSKNRTGLPSGRSRTATPGGEVGTAWRHHGPAASSLNRHGLPKDASCRGTWGITGKPGSYVAHGAYEHAKATTGTTAFESKCKHQPFQRTSCSNSIGLLAPRDFMTSRRPAHRLHEIVLLLLAATQGHVRP